MESSVNRSFYPRLSEATQLLPLIRRHLFAAASRRPLATALHLVPIVEDGLFGYELIPDRETHTYPILGCNAEGEPALRKTSYGVGTPDALQLVAVNGRVLSRGASGHPATRPNDVSFYFPTGSLLPRQRGSNFLSSFRTYPDAPRSCARTCTAISTRRFRSLTRICSAGTRSSSFLAYPTKHKWASG
jgi:hypothetical protein